MSEIPKIVPLYAIYLLSIRSENQNIEYKEAWRDEYLKWVCGFANAQGGRIYLGVNDNKEVIGLPDSKRLMKDIPNKIVSTLGIVADVNLLEEKELEYIEIVVAPNNMPIAYKGTITIAQVLQNKNSKVWHCNNLS